MFSSNLIPVVFSVILLVGGIYFYRRYKKPVVTPSDSDGSFTRPPASFADIRTYWTPEAASSINAVAGNYTDPTNFPNLLKQLKIISSEVKELFDAIEKGDILEFRNALADILFTVHGFYHRFGSYPKRDQVLLFSDLFTTKESIEPTYILEGIKHKLNYFTQFDRITVDSANETYYNLTALEEDVYVLAHSLNILEVVSGDYVDVCQEQFSKFDTSKADSLLSKLKFDNLGVETIQKQTENNGTTYWVTLSAKEQLLYGETIVKGKWLKGHNHKVPVHAELDGAATGSILSVINAYQDLQTHQSVADGYDRDAFVAAFHSGNAGVAEFYLLENAIAEYVGNNVEAVRAKVTSLLGVKLSTLINTLNAGPGNNLAEDLAPLFVKSDIDAGYDQLKERVDQVKAEPKPTFEEQKAKYLQALESAIRTVVSSFPGVELVSFEFPEVAYSSELSEHQEELINEATKLVNYKDYFSEEYYRAVLENGLPYEDLTGGEATRWEESLGIESNDESLVDEIEAYYEWYEEIFIKFLHLLVDLGIEVQGTRSHPSRLLDGEVRHIVTRYVSDKPVTPEQLDAVKSKLYVLNVTGWSASSPSYIRVGVNIDKGEFIVTQIRSFSDKTFKELDLVIVLEEGETVLLSITPVTTGELAPFEEDTNGLDETPLEPIPEFESLVESVKQNLSYPEESSSNEFKSVEPVQIETTEIYQSVSSAGIVEDYGSLTTEETYRTDDNQSVN